VASSSIGLSERESFIYDLVTGNYKSEAQATGYADSLIKAESAAVRAKLYSSKNNTGIGYGSILSEVWGGYGNDKFYAGNYTSSLDGGDGTGDTVYLTGAFADWIYADGTTLEGSSFTDRSVTLKNTKTAQDLKLKNIETFSILDTYSSLMHT